MRVQLLAVQPEYLVDVLKSLNPENPKMEVVENGLPLDAECIGVSYDPGAGIIFKLKSMQYEDVPPTCRIPFQRPMALRMVGK
jgi:hypothetical protein